MVATMAGFVSVKEFMVVFQSPFHRGNGCYQYSILGKAGTPTFSSFSPLFIGAMVATTTGEMVSGVEWYFQSPFHRGNGCYLLVAGQGRRSILAFSPLFIGAMVATVSLMCKP